MAEERKEPDASNVSKMPQLMGYIVVMVPKPVFFPIMRNTEKFIIDGRQFLIELLPEPDSVIISETRVSIESNIEVKKVALRTEIDCRRKDLDALRDSVYEITSRLTRRGTSELDRKALKDERDYKEMLCRQHDDILEQIEETGREFTYMIKTKSTHTQYTLRNRIQSAVDTYVMVYLMVMQGVKDLNDPVDADSKSAESVDVSKHKSHLSDSDNEEGDTDDDPL
jgi:hypothetical protein